MPLDKYFKGSGEKVMKSMKEQYGDKKGKSIFYATANKRSDKGKSHKKNYLGPSPKLVKEKLGKSN